MTDISDEVVAIEKGFWTQADDQSYFAAHVADEAIMVMEPMGFIEKEQLVGMPAEKPWIDVKMSDLRVHQVSPDVVVLAYHGQGRHDGDAEPYRGSIGSVYLRRDGEWQLAFSSHQPWKPSDD